MRRALFAAALSLGVTSALPAARAKSSDTSCRVKYATGKRAYLNVGASDGVQKLDNLPLVHSGKRAGSCTVDIVSDNASSCIAESATAGDSCKVLHAPPNKPSPPVVAATPSSAAPTASTQAQIDRALESAPVDRVVFHGNSTASVRGQSLFVATIGHSTWTTFDGSHYEQERIDLQLRGVSLRFGGFRAYAALTAIVASVRPTEQRFRPNDIAQVYVWQTEISSREHGRPFAFAIGRIWPHFAPGLPMLDGAQVGWRKRDGSVEVGVLGGMLPDPSTLYPAYRRWLAGVYYGHVWNPRNAAGPLRLVLNEGRINIRETSTAGLQLESEMSLLFSFGKRFDFATAARATLGAGSWSSPSFEAARVHFNVRPTERLRVAGSFRYLGARATDYDGLGTMYSLGRQYYGTLDLVGDILPWLGVSVGAQVQHDALSTNGRQTVQGEVAFRKLPRRGGGVAIGYQESFGWLRGHAVYLQYTNAEIDRVRFMMRATYAEDQPIPDSSWHREVSVNLFGEVRLVRWLALRLSTVARVVVANPAGGGGESEERSAATAGGVFARVDLVGAY